MGNLRSVGGRGEVDLDQRAITTEDDIVDLSELDRSDEQPNQPAPATQNGAAEHDEPSEGQPPAAASRPTAPHAETPPANDAPGRESDEDFDRWVADRAPGLGSALAASKPSTPLLASDARELASGDAPTAASGAAGVPCEEPTVPPVTSSRSRLRRSGPLSRPLGRLARPAAAIGALTLSAGGTAIAINAATAGTPHARAQISTSNAALTAGPGNRASDALSATIAAVTSELHALARAVPPRAVDARRIRPTSPGVIARATSSVPQTTASRGCQRAKHRVRANVPPAANVQLHAGTRHVQQPAKQPPAHKPKRPEASPPLGKTGPSAQAGAPPAPSKETPVQCSRP